MTDRLITAVCKADVNLKSAIFRGNLNIFPQVQPKRLELRQFLSQLSSHPPKRFGKPFNQNNGNKSGACTAGGIGPDQKSSSLSGGVDGGEGGKGNSKSEPGSNGKNKTRIYIGTASILGICLVYLNQKDFNWKGVVDNFVSRSTVECECALAIPEVKTKPDETVQTGPNAFHQEMTVGDNEKESKSVDWAQLVNGVKSTDPQIQCGAINSVQQLSFSSPNPPLDFLILPTLVDLCFPNGIMVLAGTSEQSQAVVEAGAVPHFLRLLKSPNQNVRESALAALEALILKGPQQRDWVINLEVVASLLNCIQLDTTRNFLHKVLRTTALTLEYLTDGGEKQIQMIIDSGVLPKLVQLLNHGEEKVQDPALRAVENIFKHGTNDQVQAVLNCDALPHFHNLLNHPNKNICKTALLTLSNVAARDFTRVQAVIDAGLVPLSIHHMQKGDFQTQKAAVEAISFITFKGTKEHVEHLVDCGVITLFTGLLSCKDSVVVWNVLVGIQCILAKLPLNQGSGDNGTNDQVQALLNCDALSHFHNLLNHPKKNICMITLQILSKVAESNFSRVQAVIDAGLVPFIIHHLEKGDLRTQKAAAKTLGFMTQKGTKEQVGHLIDCGVIPSFCNLLNSKDSEVVLRVVFGIYHILVELSDDPDCVDKACTLIKECGGCDKIQTLQNHENMEISKTAHDIRTIMEKLLLRRCEEESLSDAERR